ncbi:MAG TPA: hypothetical protein DEP07_22505 [Brevibacillus sp.]|nr:hypothetical protein [Brevibacillus sp.]
MLQITATCIVIKFMNTDLIRLNLKGQKLMLVPPVHLVLNFITTKSLMFMETEQAQRLNILESQ